MELNFDFEPKITNNKSELVESCCTNFSRTLLIESINKLLLLAKILKLGDKYLI